MENNGEVGQSAQDYDCEFRGEHGGSGSALSATQVVDANIVANHEEQVVCML